MAITREQLVDLGFKLVKRAKGFSKRKYDTLLFPLNKTDYIFTGYNNYSKTIDFKRLYKSFTDPTTNEVITYPIDRMGVLTYNEVKEYLERAIKQSKLKEEIYGK